MIFNVISAALLAVTIVAASESAYPGLRTTEYNKLKAEQFYHFFDGLDIKKGAPSYVSKNFYVDTGNEALVFTNYGQDIYLRSPCSMSSPHYHSFGSEISLNIGPGDTQYVLMISDDMRRVMFYRLKPFSSVVVPAGWIHSIINTCEYLRTVATFGTYDQGNTIFSIAPLNVTASALELYGGATQEEFYRIFGWVQAGDKNTTLPFASASRNKNLAPECKTWCAQNSGNANAATAEATFADAPSY